MIIVQKNGKAPTQDRIDSLFRQMKNLGIRTDWTMCEFMDDGAIMFQCEDVALFAYQGKFLTETEYLDCPPAAAQPTKESE